MSSRRPPNQPSSSTNRSTPTAAARVGEPRQAVEVVVEVDGLPGVEHDRPRAGAGGRGWRASGAHQRRVSPSSPVGRSARRPPAARCRSRRARAAPRRAAAARRRRAAAACGPAPSGSRSTRCTWLPLQATCTAHTSPRRKPKPGVPTTSSRVASWPVRPRRRLRSQVPWRAGCRCGERSRHQRPVRSSTSPARAGSGSTARSAATSRGVGVAGGVGAARLDDEHAVLVEPVAHDDLDPHVGCRGAHLRDPVAALHASPPSGGRCARRRGARHTRACRASPRPRWGAR